MPLFPPVQLKKPNQARVDWRIKDFRKAIWNYGQQVTWELAARCPCRQFVINDETRLDEDLGHSRVDCPECNGSGTIYHSSQTTTALAMTLSRDPNAFQIYGQSVQGGCKFTTLPENRPHFLDRLTLTQTVMPYHDVRIRRHTTETPRYPIVVRSVEIASAIDPTEPTTLDLGVIYVRKVDGSGRVDGAELVEGTDFTVNAVTGELTWLSSGSPPGIGSGYTISYYSHPVYIVHEMGFAARDTYVKAKQETPQFKENVTAVTHAWLEILGPPGWPS